MTEKPYILCIETGTDVCSVGLARGGELVSLRESSGERDHARRVAVYVEEVLAEAGIEVGNGNGGSDRADLSADGLAEGSLSAGGLAAVAVSKGPGSYTGLRIGVSLAKGLCYGLGIPLIGVGSLESLCELANTILKNETPHNAIKNTQPALRLPMIDARRMEVFGQVFDSEGRALTSPEAWIIDHESLAGYRDRDVVIFGSGAEKCREALPWARYIDVEPSARGLVRLATDAFEAGRWEDTAYFEPLYLKDFLVTTSKKTINYGLSGK